METSCDILCGGARKLIRRLYSVRHAHVFQLQDTSLGVAHLSLAGTTKLYKHCATLAELYCMVPSAYGYRCVKPMYVYRQNQDGELLRHAEWGTIFAVLWLQWM